MQYLLGFCLETYRNIYFHLNECFGNKQVVFSLPRMFYDNSHNM